MCIPIDVPMMLQPKKKAQKSVSNLGQLVMGVPSIICNSCCLVGMNIRDCFLLKTNPYQSLAKGLPSLKSEPLSSQLQHKNE